MNTTEPDIPAIHREFGNEIGNYAQALVIAQRRGEGQEEHAELDAATDHLNLEGRRRLVSLLFPSPDK